MITLSRLNYDAAATYYTLIMNAEVKKLIKDDNEYIAMPVTVTQLHLNENIYITE